MSEVEVLRKSKNISEDTQEMPKSRSTKRRRDDEQIRKKKQKKTKTKQQKKKKKQKTPHSKPSTH